MEWLRGQAFARAILQSVNTAGKVGELQKGKPVDVNDPTYYDNGAKVVPTFLLTPQLVTRENAAES